jgi:hypothetical protein
MAKQNEELINFWHYDSWWEVYVDEDSYITKAFYNDKKVKLTPWKRNRIINYLQSIKLW